MTFKETLAFFWTHLKQEKLKFLISGLGIVVSTFFAVISPRYLGRAIEELVNYVGIHFSGGQASLSDFHGILGLLILFALFNGLAGGIQIFFIASASGHTTNRMSIGMFKKIQKLAIRFFDTRTDGDLLSRFTSDMNNISNALQQYLIQIASNLAMMIGVVIMMFLDSPTLGWVVLSTAPIAWMIAVFIVRQAKKHADLRQDNLGKLNGFINEKISSQKIILANGLEEETVSAFHLQNEDVRKNSYKNAVFSGLLFPMMTGISLLNIAMVIFVGGYLALAPSVDRAVALALIVVFVQYSQSFYRPLTEVSSQYSMMQLAFVGARRVKEVLDEADEPGHSNTKTLPTMTKEFSLRDVNFGYVPDKPVLKNLNMDIYKGKMVAVVGPTGSGKTTIMNLINRFYDVDSGAVLIDGQNIQDFSVESVREQIGIVLQDSVIFTGTIRENIAFSKPTATQEEIEQAARMAHIHDFIMSQPDGYDTHVSEETSVFSTGQKQLVSIARTIMTDPSLLILDEATSNVDTVTESKIQAAMDNIIQGKTSLVIAHRLKTILKADHIIVLHEGTTLEEGNHKQLLAKNGFYAELYRNQFVID